VVDGGEQRKFGMCHELVLFSWLERGRDEYSEGGAPRVAYISGVTTDKRQLHGAESFLRS
jgi:hypothetical protein